MGITTFVNGFPRDIKWIRMHGSHVLLSIDKITRPWHEIDVVIFVFPFVIRYAISL